MADVIGAVDGPIALTDCTGPDGLVCEIEALWSDAHQLAEHQPRDGRGAVLGVAGRDGGAARGLRRADAGPGTGRLGGTGRWSKRAKSTAVIAEVTDGPLQVRLRHRDRVRVRAQGAERRHRPLHLCEEGRARLAARMASRGFPALADHGRTRVGLRRLPADRLPGRLLLRRAEEIPTTRPRASTRSTPSCWRPTRSSAFRCTSAPALAGVAVDAVFDSVSVATTFKEKLEEAGVIFCPISEGGAEPSGAGAQVSRQRRSGRRQFLRHPQLRGVQRRHLRLRAQGRALPDGTQHLFPDKRRQDGPVRTHADRRRRGPPM